MPRKTDAGNPRDWLLYARADLEAVEALIQQRTAFVVCRGKLAEALEKLIKADLIARGWSLRKIHDLQALCDDLAAHDTAVASRLQPFVDALAESYTQSRYPGFDLADENWAELTKLVKEVRRYFGEAESRIRP